MSTVDDHVETIVHWLDTYLNRRELVAQDAEGWFTSTDIDDARSNLIAAIKAAIERDGTQTVTSVPADSD